MDTASMIRSALELSPAERLMIIEILSRSLSEPDKDIDEQWKEEVEKRFTSFLNGKIKSIFYDEIKKQNER